MNKSVRILLSILNISFINLAGIIMAQIANAKPIWLQTFFCEEYTITIKEEPRGKYQYEARSRYGNLDLSGGTLTNTEGVRVFKFRNTNTEYWVWDGTLDSEAEGILEVYQNNKFLMRRQCHK